MIWDALRRHQVSMITIRHARTVDIFEAAGRRIASAKAQPLDTCTKLACKVLEPYAREASDGPPTQFLIEQQPMRLAARGGSGGSRMKSLSLGLYGFFTAFPSPVSFYHAKNKQQVGRLIPDDLPSAVRERLSEWQDCKVYADRKRLGVECMRGLIECGWMKGNEESAECLSSRKADDVSDAIAQGCHWLLCRKRGAPPRVVSIDVGMRTLAIAILEREEDQRECGSDSTQVEVVE